MLPLVCPWLKAHPGAPGPVSFTSQSKPSLLTPQPSVPSLTGAVGGGWRALHSPQTPPWHCRAFHHISWTLRVFVESSHLQWGSQAYLREGPTRLHEGYSGEAALIKSQTGRPTGLCCSNGCGRKDQATGFRTGFEEFSHCCLPRMSSVFRSYFPDVDLNLLRQMQSQKRPRIICEVKNTLMPWAVVK